MFDRKHPAFGTSVSLPEWRGTKIAGKQDSDDPNRRQEAHEDLARRCCSDKDETP
jgi:hypothetical protein